MGARSGAAGYPRARTGAGRAGRWFVAGSAGQIWSAGDDDPMNTPNLNQLAPNHDPSRFDNEIFIHQLWNLCSDSSYKDKPETMTQMPRLSRVSLRNFTKKQVALPPPDAFSVTDSEFVIPRMLALLHTGEGLREFACDCGWGGRRSAGNRKGPPRTGPLWCDDVPLSWCLRHLLHLRRLVPDVSQDGGGSR